MVRKIRVKVDEDFVEIEAKRGPYIAIIYNPQNTRAFLAINVGEYHYQFDSFGNLIPPEDPD